MIAGTVRRGFVLLEVLLATAFFSIAAVGFIVALHKAAEVSILATQEADIARVMDSAMTKALSQPRIVAEEIIEEFPDLGDLARLEITTLVEPLEIQNQEGQMLSQVFEISVTARWREDGINQERTERTWRYARLYQQQ